VELKHLAETYNFGEFLCRAMRDHFVCGLVSSGMQKRLLNENDLTLSRVIEITSSMEAAKFKVINIKDRVASKINKFYQSKCNA